jgi:hypothetical protein
VRQSTHKKEWKEYHPKFAALPQVIVSALKVPRQQAYPPGTALSKALPKASLAGEIISELMNSVSGEQLALLRAEGIDTDRYFTVASLVCEMLYEVRAADEWFDHYLKSCAQRGNVLWLLQTYAKSRFLVRRGDGKKNVIPIPEGDAGQARYRQLSEDERRLVVAPDVRQLLTQFGVNARTSRVNAIAANSYQAAHR